MTKASALPAWPDQEIVFDCDHPQRMGVYEQVNWQARDLADGVVREHLARRRASLIRSAIAAATLIAAIIVLAT